MLELKIGAVIAGNKGTTAVIKAIDGDVVELFDIDNGRSVKVRRSAIVRVLSQISPELETTSIQIGDRLHRLPAKRTSYPASWFGKDDRGSPIPDIRPSISEIFGTVTGLTSDGYEVQADDGRYYRVSDDAIDGGAWVKVLGQNN